MMTSEAFPTATSAWLTTRSLTKHDVLDGLALNMKDSKGFRNTKYICCNSELIVNRLNHIQNGTLASDCSQKLKEKTIFYRSNQRISNSNNNDTKILFKIESKPSFLAAEKVVLVTAICKYK